MAVNSLFFLMFLTVLCLVYYLLCPKKWRWLILLSASLLFYFLACTASPLYMLLTSVSLWAAGNWMERPDSSKETKKRILTIAVLFNLGILLVLKYGGFFTESANVLLAFTGLSVPVPRFLVPLGISYYTLIGIGYLFDVYKGRVKAQKNYAKFLLFLAYFPQMTQGPLNRYKDMEKQLYIGSEFDYHNISYGCQRMLWGFFQKLVVADRMQPVMQTIFDDYAQMSGILCFLGCVYMTVWMYADFSGYMNIVAGASEMLGIHIAENFKRPFFSKSLAEYWRRWHITLSAWFRDYMFYPLAISKPATRFGKRGRKWFGVRVGKLFPSLFALFFVWFCTGFWHAASMRYILWGVANGVFIMGAMICEPWFAAAKKALHIQEKGRFWQVFSMIRTFLLVCLLKVFPGTSSMADMWGFIRQMFTDFHIPTSWQAYVPGLTAEHAVYLAVGIAVMFVVDVLQERQPVRDWLAKRHVVFRWGIYLLLLAAILCVGEFGTAMTGGFAYAQF